MCAYPILMNVVVREIEIECGLDEDIRMQTTWISAPKVFSILLRVSLVSITAIIAVFVPFFADMMTLVG